jgi:hypothetical protein
MIEVRRQFDSLVRGMPIDGDEYEVVDSEAATPVAQGEPDNLPPF